MATKYLAPWKNATHPGTRGFDPPTKQSKPLNVFPVRYTSQNKLSRPNQPNNMGLHTVKLSAVWKEKSTELRYTAGSKHQKTIVQPWLQNWGLFLGPGKIFGNIVQQKKRGIREDHVPLPELQLLSIKKGCKPRKENATDRCNVPKKNNKSFESQREFFNA